MMRQRGAAAILVLFVALLPASPAAQSLVRKLLRIAGITAGGAVRGPADEVVLPGDIWIADLNDGSRRPLTRTGEYRTPVFSPSGDSVFALKGDAVVRLSNDGRETQVGTVPGATQLVGFDADTPTDLVVLREEAGSPIAVLSLKSGSVTPVPQDSGSAEERQLLSSIRRQTRTYGDTVVYLNRESKRGAVRDVEWTDVYVKHGAEPPRNVSLCDGVPCSQPALSADRRRLAFVRVTRTR